MKIIPLKDARAEDWCTEPFTPEQLKEAYALLRTSFTADDLQKFTELDEGVLMEVVLDEMRKAQQQHDRGQAS
jgi:hypothetical protein